MTPIRLRDGRINLRGRTVHVYMEGVWRRVTVVTHIRGDRWLVTGPELPLRCGRPWGERRTIVTLDQKAR